MIFLQSLYFLHFKQKSHNIGVWKILFLVKIIVVEETILEELFPFTRRYFLWWKSSFLVEATLFSRSHHFQWKKFL